MESKKNAMKISFITTVFNEEKYIIKLLESLTTQSKMPDEIIFVDGGSTDNTVSVISNFQFSISNKKIKIIIKKGNRSVGRNEAIRQATGDVIVCSDAGCILDKDWIKNITEPFKKEGVDVVAGYYDAKPENIFQKCLVPYVLVMPDKINPNTFLPATRSIAFTKSIWARAGEFPEQYVHNEDYVFARMLRIIGASITFQKNAIVYWLPRKNLKDAFIMFFRFAVGDAEAGIVRPKVLLLFVRYLLLIILIDYYLTNRSVWFYNSLVSLPFIYLAWSIIKNYRYVKHWHALFFLPLLQLTADIAVLAGTTVGLLKMPHR